MDGNEVVVNYLFNLSLLFLCPYYFFLLFLSLSKAKSKAMGRWWGEILGRGDAMTREQHPFIGKAKDVAAGAVLVAAIAVVVVGVIVLWGHLV